MPYPLTPLSGGDNKQPNPPNEPWAHLAADDPGAELARDARVWKVYVWETDKWDAELVDGWNKSLDLLLVFAALFSAISTSFLLESSGMLKQDPNAVSASALIAISQALIAIANSSSFDPATTLGIGPDSLTPFTPSRNAVVINTLWYLSLSISIATSFLAMLAKEWCASFAAKFVANRTGHPCDQAHRRTQKWTMIERWKMQEIITFLPSLIHVSLLLFSIGLCVYLWDLNTTTAIPVICVSGAAIIFYMLASSKSTDKATSNALAYIQALSFLKPPRRSDKDKGTSISDTEVMIQDFALEQ
ncbi:unnamed protein product [Rhizoctonia solani]|uniref:DUF6535 domain-containing protein n=1 Tax=Rhizoctonia solani TaxID=456999 RepID=A0A8H3DFL8_9AGAM|nr:unnamed protein product [Rhizoctonia solani]CAE6526185.1 unnamed protein product [Rhizoctonia solani]